MPPSRSSVVELKLRTLRRPTNEPRRSLEVHAGSEGVSNFLREYGIWQRPLTQFAHSFLRPGDVAVDVGAHIGYFSTVFGDAVGPTGAVHAFEPDPESYRLLERNRLRNGFEHIVCRSLAVSDRSEEVGLHRSGDNLWGSSLIQKSSHSAEVAVRTETLDRLLEQETRPISLIKVDVEGAELAVLRGMAGLLGRQPVPPAVILEFAPRQMEAADPGLRFFSDLVLRFGFQVRAFISHEGAKLVPPRVDLETLMRIHQDFLRFGEVAELDLLLAAPEAVARLRKS